MANLLEHLVGQECREGGRALGALWAWIWLVMREFSAGR